jgi:hypothetical protein
LSHSKKLQNKDYNMKKSELKQLIKEEIEKVLNEAKKTFKLKIINKNGSATIQQVSVDTSTTELFDIVALIKKSPKVEDVKILDEEVKKVVAEAPDEYHNYYIATQDTKVKNLKGTRSIPVPKGTVITAAGGGIWQSVDGRIRTGIDSLKSNNIFKVLGTELRTTAISLTDKLEAWSEQTKKLIQQSPEQAEDILKKRMQIMATIDSMLK